MPCQPANNAYRSMGSSTSCLLRPRTGRNPAFNTNYACSTGTRQENAVKLQPPPYINVNKPAFPWRALTPWFSCFFRSTRGSLSTIVAVCLTPLFRRVYLERSRSAVMEKAAQAPDSHVAAGQGHPPHHGMSAGEYIATRFTSLKPPMLDAPNPFRLLRMLNRMQWAFFLIAFFAWVRIPTPHISLRARLWLIEVAS